MKWSSYQNAIFDAVRGSGGDLVVQARAGTGKTSTIVEASKFVPKNESTLMVAFNKGIAKELQGKAPVGVEVATLHSYGFRAVRKAFGKLEVDQYRTRKLIRSQWDLPRAESDGLCDAVSICKNMLCAEPAEMDDLFDRFDIDNGVVMPRSVRLAPFKERQEWLAEQRQKFIKRVHDLLLMSAKVTETIDFDDMIWLPHIHDLRRFQYERVFVDEAQDLNPAQVELALGALREKGRLAVVGDRAQAIYGFRGASAECMDLERAVELPLPICYRCSREVVRVAQKVVPDIQPWEEARDGMVDTLRSEDQMLEVATGGDFILSRTNAPLVGLWLQLVEMHKPCTILGDDAARGLTLLIRKSKADTTDELLKYVELWAQSEQKRLTDKGKSTRAIDDKVQCIFHLCSGLQTVDEVLNRIFRMFSAGDNGICVTLSTVHKAKGLERRRVFLLAKTFCWSQEPEEMNLFYVAVTRAQEELFIVDDREQWQRERSYLPI